MYAKEEETTPDLAEVLHGGKKVHVCLYLIRPQTEFLRKKFLTINAGLT